MDEQMKSRLTSSDVWVRGLYIILFAIAWGLSELLLAVTVLFQFLAVLVTGSANGRLLRFGQNLSRYHYQIARFVSFNTEEKPFPFSDWPDEEPGGERWRDQPVSPSEDVAQGAQPGVVQSSAEGSTEWETSTPEVSESRKDESPPPA